jgi:hypothetical protein
MINSLQKYKAKQLGQAMTEMLVASAFVLVPLFLIIPLVGKYIDMKQASVSAARYAAWERTVYFSNSNDQYPSGFSGGSNHLRPVKSNDTLRDEIKTRIYGQADAALDANNSLQSFTGRDLWRDHRGNALLKNTAATNDVISGGTIEGTFASVIDTVGSAIQKITSILSLGQGSFDVIKLHGNNEVSTSLAVNADNGVTTLNQNRRPLLNVGSLEFKAKAQVYSYAWSAGGKEHLAKQVVPLVPTKSLGYLLEQFNLNKIISGANISAQDLASIILLSPEIDDDFLEFGKMDFSVLPRDKYVYKDNTETTYQQAFTKAQSDGYQASPATPAVCDNKGYCRE